LMTETILNIWPGLAAEVRTFPPVPIHRRRHALGPLLVHSGK
jgi:hypothetical protein